MTAVSMVQHGMWVTATKAGGAAGAYHMPLVVRFAGDVDPGALARAVAAVVERHPLLATAIEDRDGVAHLVAAAPPALRSAGPDETVAGEIVRPFDLAAGPLARFALFHGSTLVITAHHLVFDGASKDVLLADLATAYNGRAPEVPTARFADHAGLERVAVEAAQPAAAEFWAGHWAEPLPLVVADRVLMSRQAGPGDVLEFPLARPTADGVTRFEAVLATVHAVLFRYGNARVTTAVDLSTRTEPFTGVVGPMVNELPIDSSPRADMSFAELATAVRATLRETYPHRVVPLARAVPRIRPHAALAPISVSYRRRQPTPAFDGTPASIEWMTANGAVRGDLQLQIVDDGETLSASLRFSPAAADVAPTFAGHLQDAAREFATDPAAVLGGPADQLPQPAGITIDTDQILTSDEKLADVIRLIWEDVLKISPISDKDDLFDLGGHSLTITQIIARMRKNLQIEVSMDAFFDDPTIAGIVSAVVSDRNLSDAHTASP